MKPMSRKRFKHLLEIQEAFKDDPQHPIALFVKGVLKQLLTDGKDAAIKSFHRCDN